MSVERLYTLRELSELTGCSVADLKRYVADGHLQLLRRTARSHDARTTARAWEACLARLAQTAAAPTLRVTFNAPAADETSARRTDEIVNVDHLLGGHTRRFARGA